MVLLQCAECFKFRDRCNERWTVSSVGSEMWGMGTGEAQREFFTERKMSEQRNLEDWVGRNHMTQRLAHVKYGGSKWGGCLENDLSFS